MFDLNKFKNKTALINENHTFSYQDIINKINLLKKFIGNLKNNVVILIVNNSVEFIFLYIFLLKSKAKIILVNEEIKDSHLLTIKKKFKPNYIIKPKNLNSIKIKSLNKKEIFNYEIYKINTKLLIGINKEISILLSTSGSTGSSKFVMLTLKNLKMNTIQISKYLKLNTKDRTITTLPFSYSYGLSILNTHLFNGSALVVTKKSIIQKSFWEILLKNKVNCLYGVPFIFEVLKKFLKKNYFDNFKFLANAGGKINTNTAKEFVKVGLKKNYIFYNMYGQTEASPRMAYINLTKHKKYESIGKPLNQCKFKLVDSDNNYIKKNGTIGELVFEGKNVMINYANKLSDLKIKRKNKYRLFTGDLGYFDDRNFFYIKGRVKRFLKINGIRVDLDQIENNLTKMYKNIFCTGIDELLKIFIIKNNLKINIDKLKIKISREVSLSISNIKIYYLNKIPLNKNAKVDYNFLNEIGDK